MKDRDMAPNLGEVLFEFVQMGGQMRVAAVHAKTGTEVTIIAPLSASEFQMKNLAVAKLRRALVRNAQGNAN
ncbi:DUF6898 family protein [Maritalea mediterranea]|uniref:DUF6898 domain-containing protein n=1 Tax=Maritalea mediterranea TaxID=2909667 RepID=A0ABS9E9U4_9HYPH|nr:hypothetical protein [Maritalea mediterranea]MCF4098178.1 hypothetical protein [Maritalea mediterranea]